ncbi:hypothetical protein EJB05_09252 [Eragrostis curvula]|uniref:Uncharacterized protein n=1 Tax=Eragrostis curvula TaxID=38414 RepID=A0A5J9W386_9POAL|nr:hypothetical protein EJB05_09252 [Eragrostis curvula]
MDVNFSCTSAENFCFAWSGDKYNLNAWSLDHIVKSFEETCYATNALIEEKIGQQLACSSMSMEQRWFMATVTGSSM